MFHIKGPYKIIYLRFVQVENLTICDGSVFPTSIGANPQLSIYGLAARNISYSTGPSGVALARLFERWGIAEQIQSRIVTPPPGVPVGSLVAQGKVALGFQQRSELINLEGITVVGDLPTEIQIITTFTAPHTHSAPYSLESTA